MKHTNGIATAPHATDLAPGAEQVRHRNSPLHG